MFGHSYFPLGFFGNGFYGPSAFHVLVGSDLTTPTPTIGAATLVRVLVLPPANDVAAGSPIFGSPAFKQKHVFATTALAAGQPALGSSSLGQKHAFGAGSVVAGVPTVSASSMTLANPIPAPPPLTLQLPTFSVPAFGQKHAMTAAWLPRVPTLATAAFGQKHVITPIDFATTVILPVASFSAGRQILATSLTAPSPSLGGPTLVQKHVLATINMTTGTPVLGVAGRPLYSYDLAAVSLAMVSAPTLTAPVLAFMHFLQAINLAAGAPAFGTAPEAEEKGQPLVWFPCRDEHWSYDPHAKWYDEDHDQDEKPVKQSIFTNLNDDIRLTVDANSLIGRTSPERGPSETIDTVSPLYLFNHKLWIDWSEVEQNAAAIAAEITARSAADTALSARVTALETRTYVDLGGVAIIAPANGFTHNVAADAGAVIVNIPSNLSSGTFKLPIAPTGRQKIDFIAPKTSPISRSRPTTARTR